MNTQNDFHWQYNILNISMKTDHFITGTHNAKIGISPNGHTGIKDEDGTVGQIFLYYRDGFKTPAFIETLDTPLTIGEGWKNWASSSTIRGR